MTAEPGGLGVGASLRRKEDERFLHGQGRFVGDITRPGMLEVAFLRSPVAHARLRGVTKPRGAEKRVFTLADLGSVRTIRANSALPGFRVSEQPALAAGKLRHVGEAIAACVAAPRGPAPTSPGGNPDAPPCGSPSTIRCTLPASTVCDFSNTGVATH